jgi:hypothetical protein
MVHFPPGRTARRIPNRAAAGSVETHGAITGVTSGADRNRQSLQDWLRVEEVTPGIHLRWLPGARVEFPYRERTLEVALEVVGTV